MTQGRKKTIKERREEAKAALAAEGRQRAPRSPRTRVVYRAVLDAFREAPGNCSRAARESGISKLICTTLWSSGWPYDWARPIRDVLGEEAVFIRAALGEMEVVNGGTAIGEELTALVRATLAAAEEKGARSGIDAGVLEIARAEAAAAEIRARAEAEYTKKLTEAAVQAKARYQGLLDTAKMDAAQTSADEALISRTARRGALASLGLAAHMLSDVKRLADSISAKLDVASMDAETAMKYLLVLSKIVKESNASAIMALELERLRVGSPTALQDEDDRDEVPVEEVERRVASIQGAIDRAKARAAAAGLKLLEGGKTREGG